MAFLKRSRLTILAGLAGMALAAQPSAAKDIKIGMVNLSLCCAYFVGMDAAVKDEASHFSNVKILSTDAKGDVAFGSQIRSYVLHPYTLVRDERDGIDVKTPAIMQVLDGDLDQFMQAYLRWKTERAHKRDRAAAAR